MAWTKWTGVILSDSLSQTVKLSSLQEQIETGARDYITKCHLMIKSPASEQPLTPARQRDVMVKSMDSGTRLHAFTSWLLCSLPVFYSNPLLPSLHNGDHNSKNTHDCMRIKCLNICRTLRTGPATVYSIM